MLRELSFAAPEGIFWVRWVAGARAWYASVDAAIVEQGGFGAKLLGSHAHVVGPSRATEEAYGFGRRGGVAAAAATNSSCA